jgi:hypothetical protein
MTGSGTTLLRKTLTSRFSRSALIPSITIFTAISVAMISVKFRCRFDQFLGQFVTHLNAPDGIAWVGQLDDQRGGAEASGMSFSTWASLPVRVRRDYSCCIGVAGKTDMNPARLNLGGIRS